MSSPQTRFLIIASQMLLILSILVECARNEVKCFLFRDARGIVRRWGFQFVFNLFRQGGIRLVALCDVLQGDDLAAGSR